MNKEKDNKRGRILGKGEGITYQGAYIKKHPHAHHREKESQKLAVAFAGNMDKDDPGEGDHQVKKRDNGPEGLRYQVFRSQPRKKKHPQRDPQGVERKDDEKLLQIHHVGRL